MDVIKDVINMLYISCKRAIFCCEVVDGWSDQALKTVCLSVLLWLVRPCQLSYLQWHSDLDAAERWNCEWQNSGAHTSEQFLWLNLSCQITGADWSHLSSLLSRSHPTRIGLHPLLVLAAILSSLFAIGPGLPPNIHMFMTGWKWDFCQLKVKYIIYCWD